MDKIEYRDYIGLPKEYWATQNFCWYMHDTILSIFHNCIEDDKLGTTINFKDETDAKKFEATDDISKWLYDNDYKREADKVVGQKVFHAILADMFHFVYESLNTIEKGKIAVSLALLRKPFRDNLLYLEWLFGNPEEFIKLVYEGDIDKYAIEKVSKENKIKIIKDAINNIKNKEFFYALDENVYYDLRYNYNAEYSLQRVWNKANHLVTTGKHIRSKEFNFVFLDKDIHLEFIDYYYSQIPHLLFYTYNIVIELYNQFVREIPETTRVYNNSLIVYKFSDTINPVDPKKYFDKDGNVLLHFPCEECNKIVKIDVNSKEFNEFRYGWGFTCPKCKGAIVTCKYIFWEDYKEKKPNLKIIK